MAAVGLYSVMSYGVAQRTREVGVRIALGATQTHVVRLVLNHGILLAGLGVIIGSAGAVAATRLIRSALVGTTSTDLPTYMTTAAVLLGTAVVACYLPARRAARMSPVDAIKAG
jgi:ABC-type antimicrobial peptide transport system permease subunit